MRNSGRASSSCDNKIYQNNLSEKDGYIVYSKIIKKTAIIIIVMPIILIRNRFPVYFSIEFLKLFQFKILKLIALNILYLLILFNHT